MNSSHQNCTGVLRDERSAPVVVAAVDNLSKRFEGPPVVEVLRGVSLSLSGGEVTAIVGPSGSGKTTLLNVLGLLELPTEGSLVLSGVDVSTLREYERDALRARKIGFVFQSFHLLPYLDSVDNVALPLVCQGRRRKERRIAAIAALQEVGLGHRLAARPSTLSGGEQQRVAVARAIVGDPQLLLCDEPTGNLDTDNTKKVLAMLSRLATPQRSVVIVTHDLGIAERADRVIRIVDGHVV